MPHSMNAIDSLILAQAERYPKLNIQDVVKALYQNEFGCGHFVTDSEEGYQWLLNEAKESRLARRESEPPFIEPLGEAFSRVHLSGLNASGLSLRTLFKLFVLSGQAECGDLAAFTAQLERIDALCAEGKLPLNPEDTLRSLLEYKKNGCPATHHSTAFRRYYAPSYRVVRSALCRWIPILAQIDALHSKQPLTLVAIEGGSASGKTTLASFLHTIYDCNVFHMDDFFLRPHQRTAQRLAEPGGNVDYERFKAEVLDQLCANIPFCYQAFDCMTQTLKEPTQVQPKSINIIEGAYSMHHTLARAYDFSIFLTIDETNQRKRIFSRNDPGMQKRFIETWIPLENAYFTQTETTARCTVIADGCSVPYTSNAAARKETEI